VSPASLFDYDSQGVAYPRYRRTDPRIAAVIWEALDSARTILNVGSGAGSYEPDDRYVVAVEPSSAMRGARLGQGRPPAVNATADALPFDDESFDASMAILTVHHWPSLVAGLAEMRRVSRRRVVVVTFDPEALETFWNAHYFPDLVEVERRRYPKIERIAAALGGDCRIGVIPVPLDCVDGFQEAFYGRPEFFLDPDVRKHQSAWAFVDRQTEQTMVRALADELASGEWDRRFGHYRTTPFFAGAFRVLTAVYG
jgi:SAM-dependent methyltransferase